MKTKTIKKSLPKSQLGSIVKAAKVVEAVDKASDAALLAKRAAAAKKAQQAEDIRIAFQRKERSALKDKLKAADKATTPKKQMGGNAGRSISQKAADRKVSKGKGTIAYKWGDTSEPRTEENKGDYIGYGKNANTTVSGFKSLKNSKKARPIQKKGGVVKKK